MVRHVYALPYYGGKASGSLRGLGAWIVELLPAVEPQQIYAEPCAGMLGVLLQRPSAPFEFVSDIDDRLVTWWRVLREDLETLCDKIELTPRARSEFVAASDIARNSREHDDLDVAWAVTVLLWQGIANGLSAKNTNAGQWSRPHKFRARPSSERLVAVHERIKDVCIDNRPADDVLRWTADKPKAVVYFDPPYRSAFTAPYEHTELSDDIDGILLAQQGRVAISGYDTEWDHLGWHRHEMHLRAGAAALNFHKTKSAWRTEVLWTNYQPEQRFVQKSLL